MRWNSNTVHRLMPGVAEMAVETAIRSIGQHLNRPVYTLPVIWKFTFDDNAEPGLQKEIDYVCERLNISKPDQNLPLGERFYRMHQAILSQRDTAMGLQEEKHLSAKPYFERSEAFLTQLYQAVRPRYAIQETDSIDQKIHRLSKAIHTEIKNRLRENASPEIITSLKRDREKAVEMRRLRDFSRDVYGKQSTLTQEEIAESLQSLRQELLTTGLRDRIHNLLPRMPAPRTIHIRTANPISVTALVRRAQKEGIPHEKLAPQVLAQVHRAMQNTLDNLLAEVEPKTERFRMPNPFYTPLLLPSGNESR